MKSSLEFRPLVCPFVRIGNPTPSPTIVSLPDQRGVHTCLRVRGWGSPNSDDWRKSLVLCLLCDYYLDEYTPERALQRSYNFLYPLTEKRLHFIWDTYFSSFELKHIAGLKHPPSPSSPAPCMPCDWAGKLYFTVCTVAYVTVSFWWFLLGLVI